MKKWIIPTVVVLIVIVLLGGSAFLLWQFVKQRGTPEPPSQNPKEEKEEQRIVKKEALLEIINEIFKAESPGTAFSVGIYDLDRDEYFGINDKKPQHAASVSKVLTAVFIYDQAEKGKIKLTDPLGTYDIETQIQYLINISNQPSWDFIDEKFGTVPQNKYAKSIGLNSTDIRRGKNLMSVKDATILLKKLAKEEILTAANRGKLFSYMQETESEDLFSPAFKQADVVFYHKTGKYLGEGHDAAIVMHTENPFILVVFTNNTASTNLISRGPLMTKIAIAVLDYFDQV